MQRTPMLRVAAGAALVAGTVALAPAPSGAQVLQTLTITKAVEGTPGDQEFDFLVDCVGEATGVEFTLTDGESIVLEDITDLGVSFVDGVECVILEREGDDPPDEVTAEAVVVTNDQEPAGAPAAGRAIEDFPITAEEPPDGFVAEFSFTTLDDFFVEGYEVDVTNVFQAPPPTSPTTSSSTTSTTRATTTTTAAAVVTTATPRFTG